MGTEVHYKMFMLESDSMIDLNQSPWDSSCTLYQEKENPSNLQCQGIFPLRPILNCYDESDKQRFRQTILKHESIFRHQLLELHRLYRRQKDFMNNLTNKPQGHVKEGKAAQPSVSPRPVYAEEIPRWQDANFPFGDPSNCRYSKSDSDFSSLKGKIKRSNCEENEVNLLEDSLRSNSNKISRRLFGLELPTDECNHHGLDSSHNGCVLSYGDPNSEKASLKSACSRQKLPLRGSCKNANLGTHCLANKFPQNRHVESSKWIQHPEYEMEKKECMLNTTEAGESRDSKHFSGGNKVVQDSSGPDSSQWEENKATTPLNQGKGEQENRKIFPAGISEVNNCRTITSQVQDQKICCSLDPEVDKIESLSSSSLTDLPNVEVIRDVLLVHGFSRSFSCVRAEVPLRRETYHDSESGSTEYQMLEAATSLGIGNSIIGITASENLVEQDTRTHVRDSGYGVDALSSKDLNALSSDKGQRPYQINLESINEIFLKSYNKDAQLRKDQIEIPIQDCSSATNPHDVDKIIEATECSSERKLIGFPISKGNHLLNALTFSKSPLEPEYLASSSGIRNSNYDGSRKSDIADGVTATMKCEGQFAMQSVSGQGLFENNAKRKVIIDLNLSFNEEESTNSPPIKFAAKINLEAPVQAGIATGDEGEYLKGNCQPVDCLEDKADIKFAAETLIDIRSCSVGNLQELSTRELKPSRLSSLYWFAEVVSSGTADIKIES